MKGFIQKNSVNLMVGDGGTGKTFAFCSLAACVASGLAWLDKPVKQCPVLIIDEESGETRISRRLGAALRGESLDVSTPIYYVSLASFKLDKLWDVETISRLIDETGAGLVIIDALAEIMDGDENSKQETLPIFVSLRKLAEKTNAAFLVIHHSNKAGGYRGSSAMKGAVESLVMVEKEPGKNAITFKFEKDRDGSSPAWSAIATWLYWDTPEETFTLRPVEIEKEKRLSTSQKYVIDYLEDHGESAVDDIIAAADVCSSVAARKAVYSLAALGMIFRTNQGIQGQGIKAKYAIAKPKSGLL